jgi:2-polyprenyl-3-methyl-5-hydroxy-6-metoxy-1,4-benzoquinol methylase
MRARRYNRLLNHRPGRVFDVGAGDCRHFEALRRHCQLEFAGVEINPSVAHEARSRGYDVATGTLEELDIGAQRCQFDIVSMYHLIEHVVDPVLVFRKAFDLLRPGGYVIGQTPAIDSWERRLFGVAWGGYHFPRHLEVFSREGLRQCIANAGFHEVTVRSAPHLQCAISVQNSLIRAGWRPRMVYGK